MSEKTDLNFAQMAILNRIAQKRVPNDVQNYNEEYGQYNEFGVPEYNESHGDYCEFAAISQQPSIVQHIIPHQKQKGNA